MRELVLLAVSLPFAICAFSNTTIPSGGFFPSKYHTAPTTSTSFETTSPSQAHHGIATGGPTTWTTFIPSYVGPSAANCTSQNQYGGCWFAVTEYPMIKVTKTELLPDASTIVPMDAGDPTSELAMTGGTEQPTSSTTGTVDAGSLLNTHVATRTNEGILWPVFHPETKATQTELFLKGTITPMVPSHYNGAFNGEGEVQSEDSGNGGDLVMAASAVASATSAGDNTLATGISGASRIQGTIPVVTIAGSRVTADSFGDFVIGSQTLLPGSSAIVVEGTTYSLSPSGSSLAVDGVAQSIQVTEVPETAEQANSYINVNGNNITPGPSGVVIAGQTLLPGSQTILSGTTYSLASAEPTLVVNDGTITPGPSGVVIAGQTLSPGSQAVVSGTTYSLDSDKSVLAIDRQTITRGPFGVEVAGHTLAPGSQTVVSGTTYSLASNLPALIVDGITQSQQYATHEPVLTLGSSTYTEDADISGFVINSQTLTLDGLVTVGSGSAVETLRMSAGVWGVTEVLIGTTSTIVLMDASRPTLGATTSTTVAPAVATGDAADGNSAKQNVAQRAFLPKIAAGLLAILGTFVICL